MSEYKDRAVSIQNNSVFYLLGQRNSSVHILKNLYKTNPYKKLPNMSDPRLKKFRLLEAGQEELLMILLSTVAFHEHVFTVKPLRGGTIQVSLQIQLFLVTVIPTTLVHATL